MVICAIQKRGKVVFLFERRGEMAGVHVVQHVRNFQHGKIGVDQKFLRVLEFHGDDIILQGLFRVLFEQIA